MLKDKLDCFLWLMKPNTNLLNFALFIETRMDKSRANKSNEENS